MLKPPTERNIFGRVSLSGMSQARPLIRTQERWRRVSSVERECRPCRTLLLALFVVLFGRLLSTCDFVLSPPLSWNSLQELL
jgi:hypothetical protein